MGSDYHPVYGAFLLLLLFVFSRLGFSVLLQLSWNSLCRPGWPHTQRSAYLCLLSAGVKGVRHHAQLAHLLDLRVDSVERQAEAPHAT